MQYRCYLKHLKSNIVSLQNKVDDSRINKYYRTYCVKIMQMILRKSENQNFLGNIVISCSYIVIKMLLYWTLTPLIFPLTET